MHQILHPVSEYAAKEFSQGGTTSSRSQRQKTSCEVVEKSNQQIEQEQLGEGRKPGLETGIATKDRWRGYHSKKGKP